MKWKKGNDLLLFTLLCFLLPACKSAESSVRAKRTIYNNPKNKIWAHRVNTVSKARAALKKFKGIEMDVFFVEDKKEFRLGHNRPSRLKLDKFFDSIPRAGKHYYWLDFKNLSKENAKEASKEVMRIIQKYQLQKKVIVESKHAPLLAQFSGPDVYTSYWIGTRRVLFSPISRNALAEKIKTDLKQYHFDALSGSHRVNPFLQRYFKYYNIHLWSGGNSKKSVKKDVYMYSGFENVRVLLVDFEALSPE